VIANFGFAPQVAKPTDPLLKRADETIEKIDALRLQVVTKEDLAALRRLESIARRR
jgi:hypothetical protein